MKLTITLNELELRTIVTRALSAKYTDLDINSGDLHFDTTEDGPIRTQLYLEDYEG